MSECVCVCRTVRSWDKTLRRFSLPHDTRSPRANAGTEDRCKCHTHGRAHDCKHAALVHSAPSEIKTRCFHSKIISVTVKQIKKGNKSDKIKARIKSCRTGYIYISLPLKKINRFSVWLFFFLSNWATLALASGTSSLASRLQREGLIQTPCVCVCVGLK